MKEILKLIRPQQWVKNLFVFIPAFFGGGLLDADRMLSALLTFFLSVLPLLPSIA